MTQSLAQQARAKIIEMIFSGTLKPSDALHEAQLSERLAMSRTPVREALRRMEYEGLIAREGRFQRVRLPSPDEIIEIFLLRGAIETETARAAVHLPRAVIDDIERRVHSFMTAPVGEGEDEWSIDDAFHRMMARATNNQILLRTLDNLRLRTHVFDSSLVPERFLDSSREHLSILEALRATDAETAAARTALHLANARDAILACLERYPSGARSQ